MILVIPRKLLLEIAVARDTGGRVDQATRPFDVMSVAHARVKDVLFEDVLKLVFG